jgi:glycosyltransferase involved in cell wall biosynthesis
MLPEKYLLYLGLLQPRKNLARLARAFAPLREQGHDHKLVIVGKRAWLYDEMLAEIETLGLDDRIHFTGYVDQEDIPAL